MTQMSNGNNEATDEKKFDTFALAREIIDNANFGAYVDALDKGMGIDHEELRQMMANLCAKKMVELGFGTGTATGRFYNALTVINAARMCDGDCRPAGTAMVWRVCAELKGMIVENSKTGRLELADKTQNDDGPRRKMQPELPFDDCN